MEITTNISEGPLSTEELRKTDAYWRAALYLCVGMIYLRDNPLLREPLKIEHVKNRLLGTGGPIRVSHSPGASDRLIKNTV